MIMNGGGCGGEAIRPFPSRSGSAVDGETTACRAPSHCLVPALWPRLSPTSSPSRFGPGCRPRRRPPPSTTPSSPVNPDSVVTHVVFRCRQRRRCLPSTPMSSLPTSLSPMSSSAATTATTTARFHRYCCRFLADCCLWTLSGALPAASPPSFVVSFDDVILPLWVWASEDADSRRADARRSSGHRRSPPSASVLAHGDGSFVSLLSSLLSR